MPRRFQFSLRALLVLMLAAACFFGGIHFERERRRRLDEAAKLTAPKPDWKPIAPVPTFYKVVPPAQNDTLPTGKVPGG